MTARPFTSADSAAMVAAVRGRPAIVALAARLEALGPVEANTITPRMTERNRVEQALREMLRAAYREELGRGGWIG